MGRVVKLFGKKVWIQFYLFNDISELLHYLFAFADFKGEFVEALIGELEELPAGAHALLDHGLDTL